MQDDREETAHRGDGDGPAGLDQEVEVSRLVQRMAAGDEAAADALFELLNAELRQVAARALRGRPVSASVQATMLVNAFYLKLRKWIDKPRELAGRRQFFALAATAMRRMLIEHAKRKKRRDDDLLRRQQEATLETCIPVGDRVVDVIELDRALAILEEDDPQAARVVQLKFFLSLTTAEIAEQLEVSSRTVERKWKAARLRLRMML